MAKKIIKGFNIKKYKPYQQSQLNLGTNKNLGYKLKKEKWSFLRFNNNFKFFSKVKTTKIKFFFSNILNVRRVLSSQNCRINSKTLKRLYCESNKGNPKCLNLLNLLESRLDVSLYRTGFFISSAQLRQFISHGNIYLNGVLVNKPGIYLKKNDLIQIDFSNVSPSLLFSKPFKSSVRLDHLEISETSLSFIYLGFFTEDNIPYLDKNYLSFLNYIFKR
jgi:ribosomal protein S4